MPLNTDSIIQQKTGYFDGASGSATLDTATTDGNTIVIVAMKDGDGSTSETLAVPSGFSWASDELAGSAQFTTPYVWYKHTSGGETSWDLDFTTGSAQVCWVALEVEGLDHDGPAKHVASNINPFSDAGTVTTRSTGTAAATSSYDVLGLAVFPARGTTSASPGWSGYTNNWSELAQVTGSNGSNGVSLAVAVKPSQALAEHECTASLSEAANSRATVVMLTAQDARWAVTADVLTGFEFGTTTTLTTGSSATGMERTKAFDGVTGSPAATTSTPRTGTYCLELSSSAAAENVAWSNTGTPAVGVLAAYGPYGDGGSPETWQGPLVGRLHVRFPSSLPSADVPLASIDVAGSVVGVLWFRNSTSKVAMVSGSGTEQASDATVSADTWIGLDFRYDARVAAHTCDWSVDYDSTDETGPVEQTRAVGSGTSAGRVTAFRLGWTDSRTATVRYDDVILSKVWHNYPIGDIQIHLLKVDPDGTPSVSGSTSNFGVYTDNGTVGAWNAANAIAALDDVPPTVGSTADGVVQTASAGTEYMIFPMQTRQAAPTEVLRALRWYFCGWAAGSQAATGPGLRVHDGTTEYILASGTSDHGYDNSTSTVYWVAFMMRPSAGSAAHYLLTQARLDAMVARVGFGSPDLTPDTGLQSLFAEVAVQPATVFEIFSGEGGAFTVDARLDTVTGGVASWLATVPAGDRGATLSWTVDGASDSHYITPDAGQAVTYEKVVGATSIEQATEVSLTVDPT